MPVKINDYEPIVGRNVIEELDLLASQVEGKVIQHINSTALGGGVAELLSRIVPLSKELGIDNRWDLITGEEEFFTITKKIHNSLHGAPIDLTREEIDYFIDTNRKNAETISWSGDIFYIHDTQPIALIEKQKDIGGNWIWRCHVDFSAPYQPIWEFLKQYIAQYDATVFSAPAYARNLPIPQALISPSIDPLSDKNRDLSSEEIEATFNRFGLDPERPTLTQISRFDYLKDPFGVITVYRTVKKYVDCQLVLAGGGAVDDPEGDLVHRQVLDQTDDDPDIHVLLLPPDSNIEINALQRGSTVILQKSLREGFGLTVAEGLWKAKPVVASAVGGIPRQIVHRFSGILTHTIDGTAYWVRQILQSPEFAASLGKNGKEYIRQNFLITRHIRDYLLLVLSLSHPGDDIITLSQRA